MGTLIRAMHGRIDMKTAHVDARVPDVSRHVDGRPGRALQVGIVVLLLIVAVAGTAVAAERVEVASVTGLVRVHNADGSWARAQAGDTLSPSMAVSTGFDGSAVLAIGSSRVSVDSVSYLTVAELTEDAQEDETTLDLSFGRVRSEVRSADNRRTDFEVRSPVSTATVKGTDFVYDGSLLTVFEGDVSLQNRIGQSHSVRAGQRSRAYGYETIESVEAYFREVADLGS
jgi:hypothetical protein